jgi:hypothetical protein
MVSMLLNTDLNPIGVNSVLPFVDIQGMNFFYALVARNCFVPVRVPKESPAQGRYVERGCIDAGAPILTDSAWKIPTPNFRTGSYHL